MSETSAVTDSSTLNTRGIPSARFIEDVSNYVQTSQLTLEQLTKQLHTLYGKYKFMESQLVSQQRNLHNKIPEIKSALTALQYIQSQTDAVNLHFELSDSLYANALVEPNDKVMLWLGANVMLEYSYGDADALLTKNLSNAQTSLASLEHDIEFLKDQITISEVNIARLHNYGIAVKQGLAAKSTSSKAALPASTSSSSSNGTIKADGKPVSAGKSFAQAAQQ